MKNFLLDLLFLLAPALSRADVICSSSEQTCGSSLSSGTTTVTDGTDKGICHIESGIFVCDGDVLIDDVVKLSGTQTITRAKTFSLDTVLGDKGGVQFLDTATTIGLGQSGSGYPWCDYATTQTPDAMQCGGGSLANHWTFGPYNITADFAIAQATTFTFYIRGSIVATNWWNVTHDGTDVLFDSGLGLIAFVPLRLTAATMTAENAGEFRSSISSYTWTNAQVVALGAVTSGEITVATLPAKTEVKRAKIIITGTAAGTTTLTVSCGRTGVAYIDYVVASDAKVAANTVYGDATAEVGTGLDGAGEGLASYTATTDVKCQFISTIENLDQVTGSTGRVILETSLLP